MAKKKKEICPYCGKSFAYLSRHKCKIKERVEGPEDDRSDVERRHERIEETKKDYTRNLKKDERVILNLISRERDIYFDELLKLTSKKIDDLELILEVLSKQSRIKLTRELKDSSWTKHVFAIDDYENDVKVEEHVINEKEDDFLWKLFQKCPCFLCPYEEKCNEDNLDQFNQQICPFLTRWIETSLRGEEFFVNFKEEIVPEMNK